MKTIDFWFSIGSTYTYLTVLRLRNLFNQKNIQINYYPFSVRTVMKEMDNIPFPPSKKSKVDYMWRDIQRRSELYKIPIPNVPVPYPIKDLDLANRIAVVGIEEGWCLNYLEATYRRWFLDFSLAGSDENILSTCKEINLDYKYILNTANSSEIKNKYKNLTNLAKDIGIFGSPTFVVGKEIFWGDDRLEDAIDWLGKP